MADYPILAASLGALNGTKTDPSDVEDASKLAAVDRQTRTWIYDFLATFIDEGTGKLKSEALGSSSLPQGQVRGSESNDLASAGREILQGTISSPDLRDGAVIETKLGDNTVSTAKLQDSSVTGDKIADATITEVEIAEGAVTSGKILDGAIVSSKLNSESVTSDKLGTGAVTVTKIADHAVTGDKLPIGTLGQILLHNGTTFVPTSLSGALSIDGTGVVVVSLTASSVSFARIAERVASGTAAGASAAASWTQKRGVSTAWVIEEQTGTAAVSLGSAGLINLISNGTFLAFIRVPAYSTGAHKARVTFTPVTGPAVDYNGSSSCASPGTCTDSVLIFVFTVSGATAGTPATLSVLHWTELAQLVNGLGLPVGSGDVERYASIELLRLSL